MNEKDYKAIAGIIKSLSWYGCTYTLNLFINKLADYFEKNDYESIPICDCGCIKTIDKGMLISGTDLHCKKCNKAMWDWTKYKKVKLNKFNKKQFLKDCGVEE